MTLERILRYTVLCGIFALPFIPLFIASSMFFPFITGKNFAFRIIVEIIFGAWVLLGLLNNAYRPKFSWILVSIAAFVGVIALADIFGENFFKSFWSNFERMEGLITLLHLFAYFLVVGATLSTERLWHWFWNTSVGVSILLGIYGFLQLSGSITINQGGVRVDATLGNATYLAEYMLFHVFVTAYLLVRARGATAIRVTYAAIIALQTLILFFTATRGAMLGLIGGAFLALLLVALFERERPTLRKWAIVSCLSAVLLIGGFIALRGTIISALHSGNNPLFRLASISLSEGTPRFMVWNMAWQGVKEKPILGWGQENFNLVFNKYYDPGMYRQEPWFDRVHNIFFDWLIAGGILGLLTYLCIYIATLYSLWFGRGSIFSTAEKSIFTGLLAGYFVHNIFVFDNIVSYIFFFAFLGFVHYGSTRLSRPLFAREISATSVQVIVTPILIILMVVGMYFFNVKGILSARTLLQALSQQPAGPSQNLTLYQHALSYNSFGGQEAREQLLQGAVAVARSDVPSDIKDGFYNLARQSMQEEIDSHPEDARLQLFMGSFLNSFGLSNEALPYLEEAHTLSPKKQLVLFEMGSSYLSVQDTAKALASFKEAFELAPEYNEARIIYAIGALYAGERALSEELLTAGFGTVLLDDDRVMKAYFDNGQYDKVIAIWQARVEKDPGNAQKHISLGAAYLAAEQRQNAIAEIEKAVALNPEFKDQGEYLIGEIKAGRNP